VPTTTSKHHYIWGFQIGQFGADYIGEKNLLKKFGVTSARFSQMIALAKRLPDEIIDVFSDEEHADKLHYITGRKLRPITLLKTDAEKIAAFEKLMYT
jgi:hypothetical protein